MKIKTLCLLGSLTAITAQSFGQVRQNVYYLKNSGARVDNVDSADYVRVIRESETDKNFYDVAEYYKNQKPKLLGKSSSVEPIVYEGAVVQYYPSGRRKEITTYQKGKKSGEYYRYFENGKVYLHAIYQQDTRPGMDYFIMDNNDSTGKVNVKDGIGHYVGYDGDLKRVMEEGDIKAGQRDGKWTGVSSFDKGAINYTEQYDAGKLIAGNSTDESGATYTYTQRYVQPSFKGGLAGFGRYLGDGIRYPQWERQQRIQGRVLISFVVKTDGTLDDFKVLENPNDRLTAEALRILKISPKWEPGIMYGKIVRVSYTVPVAFRL